MELRRKRQRTLPFPVVKRESAIANKTERLLVDFIVKTMSPLSTVTNMHFVNLIKGLNESAVVPSEKTFLAKIRYDFSQKRKALIDQLKATEWVCCTADIWSGHHRSGKECLHSFACVVL